MLFVTQTWEQVTYKHWSAKPTCRIRKMPILQTFYWPIITYAHCTYCMRGEKVTDMRNVVICIHYILFIYIVFIISYWLHCINYVVFITLYSSHYIHYIIFITLYSLYCFDYIVFISLYSPHISDDQKPRV